MRLALILLFVLIASPVRAQTLVTSAAPESVSVTVYRDPDRDEGSIDARFPRGFALITEHRRIAVPAGESVIRFEGVADGMIAVSAVVTGLPGGVVQKNRDAKLLSPAALLDGTLGHRVHLRRTDRKTGKVVEQDAILRSGADNAVVLQTAAGFEGLRCSGLPETISYDGVPPDLSAKPVLSMTTSSATAASADVTLTYLATGFDWGAHYVARMAEDGRTLDLFAWLTVANGNAVGFADAQMLAVAGRLNRESDYDALVEDAPSPVLNLQCWALPTYERQEPEPLDLPSIAMPAPMVMMRMEAEVQDIVVTSRRIAKQEDLGDLKLYRVPMRVDVNPNAQKQVALLQKRAVPFDLYYGADLQMGNQDAESHPLQRKIRMQNRDKDGLGLPLPAGGITLFAQAEGTGQGQSLLLADSQMRDRAIGEKVDVDAGESAQQRYQQTSLAPADGKRGSHEIILTNAANRPVRVEIRVLGDDDGTRLGKIRDVVRKDGAWLWAVTVPANGTARLRYVVAPHE